MTPPESVGTLGPVVCLGVHILDILGRPVTGIPPGQGSVLVDEIRITAAGTAAGTSIDLARLGVSVQGIGAIGDDLLGDIVVALLERHGVDTGLLLRKAGERTSATILPIRPNGERPALHAAGADRHLVPSDLHDGHRAALSAAAVVHVGGPDALRGFPAEALAEELRLAKAAGALVTLDVLRPGDPAGLARLAPVLPHVDWLLPNDDQLRSLTGTDDLPSAMNVIRDLGAGNVAVTRGAAGCLVHDGDDVRTVPAIPVDVVDTTGCGDGFDAGFITGLLLGAPPVEAAWLGTACGALVATGLGSDAGITNLEDALALVARHAPDVADSLCARCVRRGRTTAPHSAHKSRTMTVNNEEQR